MITKRKTNSKYTLEAARDGGIVMRVLFVLLVFLVLSPAAMAQQSISVNDITVGPVDSDDFVTGGMYIQAQPIYWSSGTSWTITVRAMQPNLGVSDDGTYIKPLDDLFWKLSDDESWIPMTQEEEEVDYGMEGEGVIYVDYVLTLDWLEDIAGNYGAELVFTIWAVD